MMTPVHNALRPPVHGQAYGVAPASQGIAADVQMAGRAGVSGVKTQNAAYHKDNHAVEATAIRTLQTGGLLMPIAFIGSMAARAVSFVVGGGVGLVHKPTGLAIKGRLNGFYDALQGTTLNDVGSFGAKYAQARSDITGKAIEGLEARQVAGAARSASINAGFANKTAGIGAAMSRALDTVDGFRPMQALTSRITDFAARREVTLLGKGTEKAAEKALKWGALKETKGLGALLKMLPSKLGKASLFNVVAVSGALMASSAMLLSSHRENREDNNALKEFAADVYGVAPSAVTKDMIAGKAVHPMVQEASHIYHKNKSGRALFNIFNVAGDALMVGNMTSAASGALMAAEMGLPAIGQMFVSENPTLSIYSALKKSETGELSLAPEQKTQAVGQLLATVPAIAKNGGMDNPYVMPVADEMVKRGMTTTQIVQVTASPAAFQKISQEVIGKIQQEQAAAAEAAPQQQATPVMHAGPKPVIGATTVHHDGMVAHGQHLGRH